MREQTLDWVFERLAAHEIMPSEAVELVLHTADYGGNRDDAHALVAEWMDHLEQHNAQKFT
jgi:hypothetical protein